MYNFKGISPEAINLLSINSFENSKAFYEEHKKELKEIATIPMRQIMLDLSDDLTMLDSKMYTDPTYTVSRIARDTRRKNITQRYRENLWVMFRRNKFEYPFAPFMWFEFTPECYSYGIAVFLQKPAQMDEIRKIMEKHPRAFLNAAKSLENAGYTFYSEQYKKDRNPKIQPSLKKYYNSKWLEFVHTDNDLTKINSPELIDELKKHIQVCTPMYKLLIEAYENMISEGLIENDR